MVNAACFDCGCVKHIVDDVKPKLAQRNTIKIYPLCCLLVYAYVMALQAEFTDNVPVTAHVTSFSSCEVFAANLFKSRSAAAAHPLCPE